MNTNKDISATYTDATGTVRTIHRKPGGGLAVKRLRRTPALALNQVAGQLVGLQIRREREKQGLSLAALAVRAGLGTSTPKQRMYEIEKGSRKEGVRLGTLYALAEALQCEPSVFLPTREELLRAAGVRAVATCSLRVMEEKE